MLNLGAGTLDAFWRHAAGDGRIKVMKYWMMMMMMVVISLLALAACQPATQMPVVPTAVMLRAELPVELGWMEGAFDRCAQEAGVSVVLVSGGQRSDVTLVWGEPEEVVGYAFLLGYDELAVIVHPTNPLRSLDLAQFEAIYSGQERNWQAFLPVDAALATESIDVWALSSPQFELSGGRLLGLPLRADAWLAPTPQAVRQSVADGPGAIGWLPARWLDASVQRVVLNGMGESAQLPVLAVTLVEPQGKLREWLACLQY